MLTPWNIPCEANTLRGQLKHSWLENQICIMTTKNIMSSWQKRRKWPALEKEFDIRIKVTLELADNLADGFSPAQLVDQLRSFAQLSQGERALIKKAVHEAYLESSGIMKLQAPLKKTAQSLGVEISRLRDAWKTKSPEGEGQVKEAWEQVSIRAIELLEIFKALPTGVVLP